ncbi:MAG TPA: glycosyltransferase family 39 protein [Candidatus Udaeobacter sp.]|nr:glycosyltransferase family 39 protein [Candidatus Udaeobacter sp.]
MSPRPARRAKRGSKSDEARAPLSRAGISDPDPRTARIAILAITLVAAFLRLYRFGHSPPGLNQDEALSGWISWCLLKTGRDMNGQAWPIFYSHGVGDFPSTLYFYALMPFQAIGGLNLWTTRLPAVLNGVLCIPLIAYVGTRMFGRWVGLTAAALLALNPWHLFLSRFGVGASQCPLFALLAVALLLKARLPLTDTRGESPRPIWAALAGISAGVACYGFHPMRLYFPLMFVALVAANPAAWWNLRKSRPGVAALALLALGFAATFGPLALRHLVDPVIARRWEMTRLWPPGTPLPKIIALVAARYAAHFNLDFLFRRGSLDAAVNPLGRGAFEWYVLPCLVAGLGFLVAAFRNSGAARALLVLLALYPAGDVISQYEGVHALRSAPGIGALVLVAAFGAVRMWSWLRSRARVLAAVWVAGLAIGAAFCDASNFSRFFGEMDDNPWTYHFYLTDLVDATHWLKPRLPQYDAVFCTSIGMLEPFAVTLVELGWEPRRWFREPRDFRTVGGWEVCLRYGKMRFMYQKLWVPDYQRLVADGRREHALFMVRPGELGLKNPVYVVRRPDGREVLWLCEVDL